MIRNPTNTGASTIRTPGSGSSGPSANTTAEATPTTPPTSTTSHTPPQDGRDLFHATRDMRTRVGVTAVTAGPTQTATPKLLEDWKASVLEAAANDRANAEVFEPVFAKVANEAELEKGEPLERGELRSLGRDVRRQLKDALTTSKSAHFAEITRSPNDMARTERDVLMEQRPRVAGLKDVFSAVAQDLPGARDNEIVLWENQSVMVVVDTFAPSPKALVVPKDPVSLPTDLSKPQLDELALVAAHVSDAFMRAMGTPPAGIWINPPQHLTVKQLHVHVLPDAGHFDDDGNPAKAYLEDPQARAAMLGFFAKVQAEIKLP